jgi:hypothetical protein
MNIRVELKLPLTIAVLNRNLDLFLNLRPGGIKIKKKINSMNTN